MLLRDAGVKSPLVVVCAGVCLGILICVGDLPSLLFCLLFAAFLLGKETLLPMFLGTLMGYAVMSGEPQGREYQEGDYAVKGRVEEAAFMQGTFRILLDDVSINGHASPGLALFKVYGGAREMGKGCAFQGMSHLKPWLRSGNLGEFDYRTYLRAQGITVSGYVKDPDSMRISGQWKKDGMRARLSAALAKDARPEAEILNAALTGDRSGLVHSLEDSFSALGITHLIAISGLNMGVVFLLGYATAFIVIRVLPPVSMRIDTPMWAKSAGLACVLLYTLFVGYSPPTARAAIMVCTAVASFLMARRPDLLESCALSGIIILLWMPWSLYSASFLLSFSAVLGMIGLTEKITGMPGWVMALAIPLVCTAFTAPLMVHLFGFVSPVSLFANLLFVPWFSFVIMPLGLGGIISLPFSEGVSSGLLSLAFDGIGIMLRASEAFGSLDPVPSPGAPWVMICYLGLVTAFFGTKSTMRKAFLWICATLIIVLPLGVHFFRSNQGLVFDFINTGQADSILITRGQRAVLIDAGSSFPGSDAGRFIVGPHLLKRGIRKLDLVVMTHPHPDHIAGIPYVLERFQVGEVWTNMPDEPSADFWDAMRVAQGKSIPVQSVGRGDARKLGGIEVQVLSPPRRQRVRPGKKDLNLDSVVVRAGDDSMRGLFMADSWGLGEIRLSRLENDISADVLKVAHHGSKGSCLDMFLRRVRPSLAVIPVGKNNLYHLPHAKALQRLSSNGIPVFRTDVHGEISVFRDKGMLCVKSGLFPTDMSKYSTSLRTR